MPRQPSNVLDYTYKLNWLRWVQSTALCAAGGSLNISSVSNVTNQIAFQNAVIQLMFQAPAANAIKPGAIEINLESGCWETVYWIPWVIDGLKLKTVWSHLTEDMFTLIRLHGDYFILIQFSLTLFLRVQSIMSHYEFR